MHSLHSEPNSLFSVNESPSETKLLCCTDMAQQKQLGDYVKHAGKSRHENTIWKVHKNAKIKIRPQK